jgi:hypothetical protein
MDAAHTAFVKCSRILQPLPPEDQRRVVRAMAILLEVIPWQEPGQPPAAS